VKTLPLAIHGGILYRRPGLPGRGDRHKHGIVSLDLVVVNLYPSRRRVASNAVTDDEAIGRSHIAAARAHPRGGQDHRHARGRGGGPISTASCSMRWMRQAGVPPSIARTFARARLRATRRPTTASRDTISRYLASSRAHTQARRSRGGRRAGSASEGVVGTPRDDRSPASPRAEAPLRGEPGRSGPGISPTAAAAQAGQMPWEDPLLHTTSSTCEAALGLCASLTTLRRVVIKHPETPPCPVADTAAAGDRRHGAQGDELSAFGRDPPRLTPPADDAALRWPVGTFLPTRSCSRPLRRRRNDGEARALRNNLSHLGGPWEARDTRRLGLSARTLLGGLYSTRRLSGPRRRGSTECDRQLSTTPPSPASAPRISTSPGAWCRHAISNGIVIAHGGGRSGSERASSRVDAVRSRSVKPSARGTTCAGRLLCSDAFLPFPDSVEIAAEGGIAAIATFRRIRTRLTIVRRPADKAGQSPHQDTERDASLH
jgi:phosphoribosylaminoimidazolecarboxamide formyltransferase/IMP cyclohydrolase